MDKRLAIRFLVGAWVVLLLFFLFRLLIPREKGPTFRGKGDPAALAS